MNSRVLIGPRAQREFKRLDTATRDRVRSVLARTLTQVPLPGNVDIKPLTGLSPWLRVRIGEHRIVCRRLTDRELSGTGATHGWYVARIVDRRDLAAALKSL